MEVVSKVTLRVVSDSGANITWLRPDEPRDLPEDMAHAAVRNGATYVGPTPKNKPKKISEPDKIVAKAVQHLVQNFDSLGVEDFAADGKPRLVIFKHIPGINAALRDAAWDAYTMNPR